MRSSKLHLSRDRRLYCSEVCAIASIEASAGVSSGCGCKHPRMSRRTCSLI
jgi:hypothetical protein